MYELLPLNDFTHFYVLKKQTVVDAKKLSTVKKKAIHYQQYSSMNYIPVYKKYLLLKIHIHLVGGHGHV